MSAPACRRRPSAGGAIGLAIALSLVVAAPAHAIATATASTGVTAQIASSISASMSTSSVNFGTLSPNDPAGTTNTTAGGTLTVTANAGYTVSVSSDKVTMTEWTGSAYVSTSPKTLASPLQSKCSSPTGTGATCSALTATSILTTGIPFATSLVGTGAGSHTYAVTLSQPTTLADSPATYHLSLTFTASTTV